MHSRPLLRLLLVCAVLAASAACWSVWSWRSNHAVAPALFIRRAALVKRAELVSDTIAPSDESLIRRFAQMLTRDRLDRRDLADITAAIRRGMPPIGSASPHGSRLAEVAVFDAASEVVINRIRNKAPMPPDARDAIKAALLDTLQSTNPTMRRRGSEILIHAGYLKDADVSYQLRSIAESDPDELVRAVVAGLLASPF